MSPQFVDYNGDGVLDIVAGTYNGSPHVALGSADGFHQPEQILDRDGQRIVLNQFWDHASKKWTNTTRCDAPGLQMPAGHGTSAVVFDIDGDGDLDLLLGDYRSGHIYIRRNEGARQEPRYSLHNEVLLVDGKPIDVPGKVATMRLVDWDGDGRADLLVSSMGDVYGDSQGGGVFVYFNRGDDAAAKFVGPTELVPLSPKGADGPTRPDAGLYADAVDLDGDGDLDLVVGGFSLWSPAVPELSAEQKERLKDLRQRLSSLDKEMASLNRALYAATEGLPEAEARKQRATMLAEQSERRQLLSRQRSPLQEEIETLEPSTKRLPFVWFYENLKISRSRAER
jgi:hypothetical protein